MHYQVKWFLPCSVIATPAAAVNLLGKREEADADLFLSLGPRKLGVGLRERVIAAC